jgi:hypothetical protein
MRPARQVFAALFHLNNFNNTIWKKKVFTFNSIPQLSINVYTNAALGRVLTNCMPRLWVEFDKPFTTYWPSGAGLFEVHGGHTCEQNMGFRALDALPCKTEVADCLCQDSKSKNIT